jgi:hypothetical protein
MAKLVSAAFFPPNLHVLILFFKPLRSCTKRREGPTVIPGNTS